MAAKKKKPTAADVGGETVESIETSAEPTPTGRSVAAFRAELDKRDKEFLSLVPKGVSVDRLKATACEAIRQNPQLLDADGRSLLGAVFKAAKDGLMPDGREGVMTVYSTKQREGGFKKVVSWNPMVHGLRKRARELDDVLVDSAAVYKNDAFDFIGGDHPALTHKRPPLGQDRGVIVGAWAIFRQGDRIKHHEVMDVHEIENTRAQSKDPESLMWNRFPGEAYRKTVVRRGFKTVVGISEALDSIVRREDEAFDFDGVGNAPMIEAPKAAQDAPTEPEAAPKPSAQATAKAAVGRAMAATAEVVADPKVKPPKERPTPSVLAVRTKMFAAATATDLAKVWEAEVKPFNWSEKERAMLQATYDERMSYKS